MLYPVFKDCLFKQVLPHIRSLELVEIRHIPLTHVLSYCRCLQTVSISAKDGNISLPAEMDPPTGVESIHLPKIRSFSVNGFVATDFSLDRSISHFLEFGGDHISSLYLCAEYCDNFPLALDFLPPLPALRHNLHDLSFGIKVYKIIAIEKRDDPEVRSILPLSTFQNLCTLTFTIWLPYHTQSWNRWFKWLARNIPHAPDSLRTLYFKVDSLYYPPYMHPGRNFVIHCNVVRRYLDDDGKLQTAVDVLKAYLRSWLDEKKLEISFSDFGGGNQGY
ncbi:hypothetical protein DL96DRAFT_1643423 [Flagelloscypha sp. PMI_526]|nr:hypothetical protein DL96DRAFT_1643423 [Flagelloscypha sp. PMI_526]